MTASTTVQAASLEDIDEEQRLNALAETELPRVRGLANSWRTGASISSSLVASAGLLGAPEALSAASSEAVTWVGYLFLGAAVATLLSLGASLRSSFGWPSKIKLYRVGALREWEQKELARVIRWLGVSMIAGVIAFVLAAAAFGTLYFGPRAAPAPQEPKSNLALPACPAGSVGMASPDTDLRPSRLNHPGRA